MKIIRNYLLREFIPPFLLAVLLLTFVMLMGNMIKLMDMIVNKGVSVTLVFRLFLLYVPYLLSYTLPVAFLVAILFTFIRFANDNELLAVRTSGINLWHLIAPFLALSIVLSLLLFLLTDRVTTRTHFASKKAIGDVGLENPSAFLEAGTFINSFERYILFIYDIDGNRFTNIRIYEPQEGRPTRTIVAKRGEFISLPKEKKVKLKLVEGTSDEVNPKDPNSYYKLEFKTFFMTLNLAKAESKVDLKPKYMTTKELISRSNEYEKQGISSQPLMTEMHKRMAFCSSCFLFALLGAPVGLALNRFQKKKSSILIAFLIGMIYFVMLLGLEALTLQLELPPILMWFGNAVFFIWGIIMVYRICES